MKEKMGHFIEDLDRAGIPLHSAALVQGDQVVFERYFGIHHKDELHRMYSVTKSLVSLAVGFLCQEAGSPAFLQHLRTMSPA
ncbi:MAG: serine hydrolase [Enterocloster sp.]